MVILRTSYWPATAEIALRETTCGGALRDMAAATPGATALIEAAAERGARRRWTYGGLYAEAERLARRLAAEFEPQSHIAVWGANRPEWIIAQFGIALSNMVMVTINPACRERELQYALRQSKSRAIFFQESYRSADQRDNLRPVCRELGIRHADCVPFGAIGAYARGGAAAALADVDTHSAAMIQYTSGTTGSPKGAVLTHYSVTNNSRMMALLKGMNAETVNLAIPPLFHTGGCVGGVLATIQTGGAILLPEAFDADLMLDLIEEERVTYAFAVPTMLIAMLQAQQRRPRDLGTLQTVFSGGTVVPIDVVKRVEAAFGATLIIGYGMTETSPAITHTRPGDSAEDKCATIGLPIPQIEVRIANPATGETCPVDIPGELCTRGFHVMREYFDMPQATAETIDADGWLHTGDLCAMDARGYCRITGRLKDMIIRGGENIYPREIEELLYTHPAIAEVAVFGAPDDYFGEIVATAFIVQPGAGVDKSSLVEFVASALARHKIPALWFAVESLPVTLSGKVRKVELGAMVKSGSLAPFELK